MPSFKSALSGEFGHLVIVVPKTLKSADADTPWLNECVSPHVLYEHNLGSEDEWPHLLVKGDTPF